MFVNMFTAFLSGQNIDEKVAGYTQFLSMQNTSAKDYVLGLFEKYDIVVLCERNHLEMTQYDLIYDIVSDQRFIDNVGHIFMEVGISNIADTLNSFLRNSDLDDEAVEENLLYVLRNADYWMLWEKTNYPVFIKKLHYLNKTLSNEKKINVHPSDIPFSWASYTSKKQYQAFMNTLDIYRDTVMGVQMRDKIHEIRQSNDPRKKYLVIMNHYHSWFMPPREGASWWLKDAFPSQTVNVLISKVLVNNLTDYGRWDAAFKLTDKDDLGFDFKNNPFGETLFSNYVYNINNYGIFDSLVVKHLSMQDMFHGFVFYKPVEDHVLSLGYPNVISGEFKKEMHRRSAVFYGKTKALLGRRRISKYYNIVKERQYKNLDMLIQQRDKWIDFTNEK